MVGQAESGTVTTNIHPWMEEDLVVILVVEPVVASEICMHWKEKEASS